MAVLMTRHRHNRNSHIGWKHFSSDHGTGLDGSAGESTETIPIFSLPELKTVVSSLKFGRCADVDGIVAEMFIYAGEDLLQCLLDIFNTMIINNSFDSAWYRSAFTMLPKRGIPRNQVIGDQ
jgi:hypothetical protein